MTIAKRLIPAVAAAVTLAVAGCGGHAVTPTSLHFYAPFEASGTLSKALKVMKTVRGWCGSGSFADLRWDAWRCSSGNGILDPCFSDDDGGKYLICPSLPESRSVYKLVLTKGLPYKTGNPETFGTKSPTRFSPWSIRLANGVWCALSESATAPVADLRISYFCTDGSALLDEVRRTTPRWTIFKAPRSGTDVTLVAISEAWW